ncbi:hypothetical protein BD408DRAFT_414847 [Parasitella parasitica]|nr:hypothetical protein BD408DRAFT_414847 [Parasitella parasitica]
MFCFSLTKLESFRYKIIYTSILVHFVASGCLYCLGFSIFTCKSTGLKSPKAVVMDSFGETLLYFRIEKEKALLTHGFLV